jgi:urate oxidase
MKLLHHNYGKAKVRVMKVNRNAAQHELKELEISVMLQGDFEASYVQENNRLVVPTDTMKNTVYVLARERLSAENETFGLTLGRHFLETYPQVAQAQVGISERCWDHMMIGGQQQAHSFLQTKTARPIANVTCSRSGNTVESGIEDLMLLKTTGSGFEGYLKDKYTTLRETKDRILATKLKAAWTFDKAPTSYAATNRMILEVMLAEFASNYSPSVQATLFEMGEAALKAASQISKITLAMPNKHCLLANLEPFGLENPNEIFIPTDEPHGQIEGTVCRT